MKKLAYLAYPAIVVLSLVGAVGAQAAPGLGQISVMVGVVLGAPLLLRRAVEATDHPEHPNNLPT